MPAQSATRLVEALLARGLTLGTAESLTGGGVGVEVTSVPGSSEVYVGGVVTYATAAKRLLLDVPASLIERHGVVSAACAEAMAEGVRRLLGVDVGVSTTGVAGPERQEGKPVGLAFVGVAGLGGCHSLRLELDGDRESIRRAVCADALAAVADLLAAGRGTLPGPPMEVAGGE